MISSTGESPSTASDLGVNLVLMTPSMNRRQFVLASTSAAAALAAPANMTATVLYQDRATKLDNARLEGSDLWIRSARSSRASTNSK